jgi:hypothetical protein
MRFFIFSKLYSLDCRLPTFCSKMVRSPGFEPGSSAWQADVLAKLDYDRFVLD